MSLSAYHPQSDSGPPSHQPSTTRNFIIKHTRPFARPASIELASQQQSTRRSPVCFIHYPHRATDGYRAQQFFFPFLPPPDLASFSSPLLMQPTTPPIPRHSDPQFQFGYFPTHPASPLAEISVLVPNVIRSTFDESLWCLHTRLVPGPCSYRLSFCSFCSSADIPKPLCPLCTLLRCAPLTFSTV